MCNVNAGDLAKVASWVAGGEVTPVVASTFPLEQAALDGAFARLQSRRTRGKLVCIVAPAHPPAPPTAAA